MNKISPQVRRRLEEILGPRPRRLDPDRLKEYVVSWQDRREDFLALAERAGSPLYVFDPGALRRGAREFRDVFGGVFPRLGLFYALKSNSFPGIARLLHGEEGFGLDVSSGAELELALNCGGGQIVFSGPGKSDDELALALENRERVTVLIDSFGELRRLQCLARERGTTIRAGVRLTPPLGAWSKFGIPLGRLRQFWEEAGKTKAVELAGIQFHTSWNLDPRAQVETISALGRELATWPKALRRRLGFLDIGGGIWPPDGEWLQGAATPAGRVGRMLGEGVDSPLEHFHNPAEPLETFARELAAAVEREIFPGGAGRVCLEPGRWLCHGAMHLLLTVVDVKEGKLAVTDAGTNAIGWERFESDYAPVINLDRPALVEREFTVVGSLCTPHDFWGYSCWGEDPQPGDRLLIPDQGAYTYSLRQGFIKSLPAVAALPEQG